ncbi:MAG: HAD family hydrolase, partial [Sciscionella sp.]
MTAPPANPLLSGYDALLVDLDGTVYRGGEPIGHAAEGLGCARRAGRTVRFVTNNAARTPETVAGRLRDLGVSAKPDEIDTSAQAAAVLLRQHGHAGDAVLVIGSEALAAEVRAVDRRPVRDNAEPVTAVVQG